MTTIIGIDPGLSGAVAALNSDPTSTLVVDMPVHLIVRNQKNKRELDIAGLVGLLSSFPFDTPVFVEQVGAMPGQGVTSMFAFGKGYGIILGVVAALHMPFTLVTPQKWRKALGVPKGKEGSPARASQLMPHLAPQWTLKKHHGRADAALIAEYGRRTLGGAENHVGIATLA